MIGGGLENPRQRTQTAPRLHAPALARPTEARPTRSGRARLRWNNNRGAWIASGRRAGADGARWKTVIAHVV
eukprot:981187-Alexandrium_andersonii.AAC.1